MAIPRSRQACSKPIRMPPIPENRSMVLSILVFGRPHVGGWRSRQGAGAKIVFFGATAKDEELRKGGQLTAHGAHCNCREPCVGAAQRET